MMLYTISMGDEVSVELQQLSYHKSQLLRKIRPHDTLNEIECKNIDHAGFRRRHGFESSVRTKYAVGRASNPHTYFRTF